MRKIELKTRKLLQKIFGGISLTAIAFVFQACYGIEKDLGYDDTRLSGKVTSKTTNSPIKGIKVSVPHYSSAYNYAITDENGNFDFYVYISERVNDQRTLPDSIPVFFADIDSLENGYFFDKEVIINIDGQNEVKISVELEEKN